MIRITPHGDWDRVAVLLATTPYKLRRALDRAVLQEAQFFRAKVVEGFRTQAPGGVPFKPLSPITLAMRRARGFSGTKALMVRGDLRNSISVMSRATYDGAEAWVGVKKNARNATGVSLHNIAMVHEFGSRPIVIRVTPKMKAFFFAAMARAGGTGGAGGAGGFKRGFIIVQIPARPFLRPVAAKWFNGPPAAARFQARVAQNMGGMFGLLGGLPRT